MKKVFQYKDLLIIFFAYLITRLINLTIIPIFNDESIYLDWGWKSFHGSGLYDSLGDGKQPLVTWLFGIAQGIFSDPLFAGRIVSVIAGVFTVYGIYKIGKSFFDNKIAIIASAFYVLIPMFAFFDRQALMESCVAATSVWTVYFFILILKKASVKNAILFGIILGLAYFIKSTVLLIVAALVICFFIFARKKHENKSLVRDSFIVLGVSQIVLLPLYFQPLFWQTFSLNDRYTLSFGDLLTFPIATWLGNIWGFLQILFWQITPIVSAAAVFGIYIVFKKVKTNDQKLVAFVFLLQLLLFIFVAKSINVRYAMPLLPLVSLFIASTVMYFKEKIKISIVVLSIIPLYFLFLQIFQPIPYFNQLQTVTTYSQKESYVTGSTAGYAATQAISYINKLSIPRAIVAVRIDAGNPENAIFTYYHGSQSRIPNYLDAHIINNISDYQCLTYNTPVIYVSRDSQLGGLDKFLVERVRFYNPEKQSSVGLYAFNLQCKGKTLDLSTPGAISF